MFRTSFIVLLASVICISQLALSASTAKPNTVANTAAASRPGFGASFGDLTKNIFDTRRNLFRLGLGGINRNFQFGANVLGSAAKGINSVSDLAGQGIKTTGGYIVDGTGMLVQAPLRFASTGLEGTGKIVGSTGNTVYALGETASDISDYPGGSLSSALGNGVNTLGSVGNVLPGVGGGTGTGNSP